MKKLIDKKYLNRLVKKIKAGNKECLTDLYEEMRLFLFNFIQCKVKNKHSSEDIVQEVFIVVMENIQKFNNKNVFSLLLTIASNKIKSFRRYGKNEVYWEDFSGFYYEYDALTIEFYLKCAIAKLNKKDKTIMSFRFFKEYTFKEISFVTGIPETTIKRRVNVFKIQMQKELKNEQN